MIKFNFYRATCHAQRRRRRNRASLPHRTGGRLFPSSALKLDYAWPRRAHRTQLVQSPTHPLALALSYPLFLFNLTDPSMQRRARQMEKHRKRRAASLGTICSKKKFRS
jgi:hypothetical protein